jgi:hypothetical protein
MPAKPTSRKPKSGRVFGQRRKETKMFRVGLYARVSTLDQQSLPMQNRTMREYAARRGWTIVMQVREIGSGAAQRSGRLARSYWKPRAAVRSTSCWSGDWIVGVAHWRIWSLP